jgi:transcription-repair coupling factor (superfamily II helicase)
LVDLPRQSGGILVVPVQTLSQRLAPRAYLLGASFRIARGQRLDHAAELARLAAAGYRRVDQVRDPGDYALRGSLIDVYPVGSEAPLRIELLDDEVDSLRHFDPETQRSTQTIDKIELWPAREFPCAPADLKALRERLLERFDVDPRRSPLLADLKAGHLPAGIESYLPAFFEHTETLFDYLPERAWLVLTEGSLEAAERHYHQAEERYRARALDPERPVLPVAEILLPSEELRQAINRHDRILLHAEGTPPLAARPAPAVPLYERGREPGMALQEFLAGRRGRVLIAADSPGRREVLLELLSRLGHPSPVVADWPSFRAGQEPLAVAALALSDGFVLEDAGLTVLTERQLYGDLVKQERRRRKAAVRDPEAIIRDLGELAIGAPVVHEDHGVGRYRGLSTLDVGGATSEFLTLEYAGGDKLYVPVAQLHLVGRYTGGAPETAPLHALGGEAWAKAKKRAAEKVRDVAAELLEIQAKRQARPGMSLGVDRSSYEAFAAGFPFEETPDQQAAIDAVLVDLARPTPMDRVVCGDVGFGKTEVALRAAFVAASAGKQVAVLVPTTLLAHQHERNFRDRFADWPIRVEVLSRFKSKKELSAALEAITAGRIEVVIGTHKLIQGEVRFKDLGLVIIDEEQRFGVRHKEQLKQLRAEVHVLTLTATPIPRTLNMALAGLRDLSIIATPPQHRLAVETSVVRYDVAVIREAVQRELARGGQVYYLHNDVATIERTAAALAEWLPEARIAIAHGQMPERELERVMADFYRQRYNVLVCSTIIESGIDIPTANTIIVERADKFGLAQLHQLRGRVGRSHHRAFAYLLLPERERMTADAEKRLNAIASLDELGAGFTLATHDLEIRGAGELLGEEQSGQIAEVGFTLYTEYLERAVSALKRGELPDFDAPRTRQAEIELHLPALLPEDYLPDVHTRLVLYKRIAGAAHAAELRELKVELIDRFGLLPAPAEHLFALHGLKLRATALGIKKLELGPNGGRVHFTAQPKVEPLRVIEWVQSDPKHHGFDGQDKLRIRRALPDPSERLRYADELLARLGAARED